LNTNVANLEALDNLEALWASVPTENAQEQPLFYPAQATDLPPATRRYLANAIASGTRLASAVRLRMRGSIKLGVWLPFTAEQVIWQDKRNGDKGFIWCATVRVLGVPIIGADQLLNNAGKMQWKLGGRLSLVDASGPDLTRSAIGRFQAESIWLPSALCVPEVEWTERDIWHPCARLTVQEEATDIHLTLGNKGQVRSVSLERWGSNARNVFGYRTFGGTMDKERTFGGYTIPTRIRVGWDFEEKSKNLGAWKGEFFRATIEDAQYR
jgi:hypothetical protein